MLLDGKVGIITGAASGMGRAAALLFAEQGSRVVCADINLDGAQEVASRLGSLGMASRIDLTDKRSCCDVVNETASKYGRVDFVANFGGIWDRRDVAEIEDEQWDRVIDVNLKGTFLICQAVAPIMIQQRYGRIVLTGSIAARNGGEFGGPHYAASKGGVMALAKSLARRLGPHNITVNNINPGAVETEMTAGWSEQVKSAITDVIPLGRIGQPVDIARVALFLASDLSSWMSGQSLDVNGGMWFS